MDFFFVIGITGIGIYATLFLYCVFQIALFIRAINKDYQFLIHKLSFHVMYGVYSLLECLYFVSLFVYDYYVRWGTAIHLMALYWNLLAFVTVLVLEMCIHCFIRECLDNNAMECHNISRKNIKNPTICGTHIFGIQFSINNCGYYFMVYVF